MQCDRARILMTETLDGDGSPELAAHFEACPACADEWHLVRALDTMLRAQPLVAPPRHFRSRVMHRLAEDARRRPRWQRSLMQIGVVVSGTLLLALMAALLVQGWQLTMTGSFVMEQASLVARGARILAGFLWVPAVRDAVRMPLYVALAMGSALAWFGALVVPRLAKRTAL